MDTNAATFVAFFAVISVGIDSLAKAHLWKPNEEGSVHSYGSGESDSGRSRISHLPLLSDTLISLSPKDQPPQSLDEPLASSATNIFKHIEVQQANAAPVHRKVIPKAAEPKVVIKNCTGQCQGEPPATAEAKVGSPSAVTNLTVKQPLPKEAVYSWERPDIPNGPIDGYIVSTGNLETNQVSITEVPGNTTTLTEKTIEQYTKYKVNVQVYNVINPYGLKQAGPAASLEFESIGEGPIPPIPEVADIDEDDVLVNWTEPINFQHGITYYSVHLEKIAFKATTTNNSVWLTGLEPWHHYTVSVSSCTLKGKCGPPKKAYFRTDVGTPTMPRQLNSTSVSRYSLGIAWTRPEEAKGPIDGYRVVVTNDSTEFQVSAKSTELTLNNLTPSSLYKISVTAFNNGAHQIKEGPAAVIDVKTLYGPKPTPQWFSIATITLMIVVPVVCFGFLVGYVVYRQFLKKREDEELLASSE